MGWLSGAADFLGHFPVRIKRGSLRGDYRTVFDSDAGRRVLADLHHKGCVMIENPGLTDSHLQYVTGFRDCVLHIDKMLRVTPQQAQQLTSIEVVDD